MLIYCENFESPTQTGSPRGLLTRYGGDGISQAYDWTFGDVIVHDKNVPRCETFGSFSSGSLSCVVGHSSLDSRYALSVQSSDYNPSWDSSPRYGHVITYLPPSKKITWGGLFHLFPHNTGLSSYPLYSQMVFRFLTSGGVLPSGPNHQIRLSTLPENFRVSFNFIDPSVGGISNAYSLQAARVSFSTGGSGFPAIPPKNVYFNFLDPFWLWIECDMTDAATQRGYCKVFLNDTEVATVADVYTGNIDDWHAHPSRQFNNVVRADICFGCNRHWREFRIHSIIALNEGLGWMHEPLGNVRVASLPVANLDNGIQWSSSSPESLTVPEVFHGNKGKSFSQLGSQPYAFASDHLSRDLHSVAHTFLDETEIVAVSVNLTARRFLLPGESAHVRIEPTYLFSGRDVEMRRTSGVALASHIANYKFALSVPFAGDFWRLDLLQYAMLGYSLYDVASAGRVQVSSDIGVSETATGEE